MSIIFESKSPIVTVGDDHQYCGGCGIHSHKCPCWGVIGFGWGQYRTVCVDTFHYHLDLVRADKAIEIANARRDTLLGKG